MWLRVLGLCSQQVLKDVAIETESKQVLGSTTLLSELIRIDLKNKADGRQIRNINLEKRVQSDNNLSLDEQVSAADRSAAAASKNRTFGAFPKTLAQLCKAIKAGRPHTEKLIDTTFDSLIMLDNETLLKVGPDLANFCSLAK